MADVKKPDNLEMERIKLERFKTYGVVITVLITVLFICVLIACLNYMHPNRELVQKMLEGKANAEQHQVYLEIEKNKLERFKVWGKIIVAAITVFFGSVLVTWINRSYQNRQLERQRMLNKNELELQQEKAKAEIDLQTAKADADQRQAEMKYLGEFVKYALEENYDMRLRFADYFAALTLSERLQKNWQSYRDGIVRNQKELEDALLELAKAEKEKNVEKVGTYAKIVAQKQAQADALPEKSDVYLSHRAAQGFLDGSKPKAYTLNDFEEKAISDNKVVIDKATGLTWQQSGSKEYMKYYEVRMYIAKLNSDKYAGYNDWRLPTLEEAITLLEQEVKRNGLYIDPVFDKKQQYIWTSDKNSASRAWVVGFDFGFCYNYDIGYGNGYVRAVR